MSGPEFFQTHMGRQFFEGHVPALLKELRRLNDNLERAARAPVIEPRWPAAGFEVEMDAAAFPAEPPAPMQVRLWQASAEGWRQVWTGTQIELALDNREDGYIQRACLALQEDPTLGYEWRGAGGVHWKLDTILAGEKCE